MNGSDNGSHHEVNFSLFQPLYDRERRHFCQAGLSCFWNVFGRFRWKIPVVESIGQVSRWKFKGTALPNLEVCVDDSNFIFTIKIAYISKQSEMRGS